MIKFDDLTLRRGTKVLLEHASCVINPGEKVALVGANGAGKSSLFGLLLGTLSADGGDFSVPRAWRVTHVAQDTAATQASAVDHVIDGDLRLRAIEAEIEAALLPQGGTSDAAGERLAELHGEYAEAGGYSVRARAQALLLGLGFSLEETTAPVAQFSGGWRMRLNLAQALIAPSDLLLLDEPTNHLDLDAIVWLEQWLGRYQGTLIVISHDREFLDAVAEVTVHIENAALKRYTGNYSAFEQMRAELLRQNASAYTRQQREIAHLQHFIDRFRAKANKARQAQSRVKALERMERVALAHLDAPCSFRFREPRAAPDPMLVLESLCLGYGSGATARRILADVDLVVRKGERIGLLGANGQGKSTFIKTLAGVLAPLSGTMRAAPGLAVGYFAQHQVDTLRLDESPLQQLAHIAGTTREQELRDYLGGFDFQGDRVHAPVGPFSGGEKARLALALLIWTRPNLLLLDEPTNHLDIDTRAALTSALAQFDGTVIVVAHDRALLAATTDRFLVVASGQVAPFEGDLSDYQAWLVARAKSAAATLAPAAPAPPAATVAQSERRADAQRRSALGAQRRPIEARIKRIEDQLAKLNARRDASTTKIESPALYEAAERDALQELLVERAYLDREIERLEEEWLEQSAQLEALAGS